MPSLWRDTPAPYGPLFLWIGRGISALTGENIVAAVLCHRVVVLIGVGLIVWATPRLARRCGVAEVSALWLGATTNPRLIMHLVAGIHNEALMLGPMLAGTEFALRGVESTSPLLPRPLRLPRHRADWAPWLPLAMLVLGVVLITMSSQVKLPSLLALGFVTMALARRWGANCPGSDRRGRTARCLVFGGDGRDRVGQRARLRWVNTLGTANIVRGEQSNFLQQDRGLQRVRHRPAHRDDVVRDGVRTEHVHGPGGGREDVEFLARQLGKVGVLPRQRASGG